MIHILKKVRQNWQTLTPLEKFVAGVGAGSILGEMMARLEQRRERQVIAEELARIHKMEEEHASSRTSFKS